MQYGNIICSLSSQPLGISELWYVKKDPGPWIGETCSCRQYGRMMMMMKGPEFLREIIHSLNVTPQRHDLHNTKGNLHWLFQAHYIVRQLHYTYLTHRLHAMACIGHIRLPEQCDKHDEGNMIEWVWRLNYADGAHCRQAITSMYCGITCLAVCIHHELHQSWTRFHTMASESAIWIISLLMLAGQQG